MKLGVSYLMAIPYVFIEKFQLSSAITETVGNFIENDRGNKKKLTISILKQISAINQQYMLIYLYCLIYGLPTTLIDSNFIESGRGNKQKLAIDILQADFCNRSTMLVYIFVLSSL